MSILAFRLPAALLALAACIASPGTRAADVLDLRFDGDGFRVLPATLNGYVPLGSCPHANGSVSVVAVHPTSVQLAVIRLTATGALDGGFSGDGIHTFPALRSVINPAFSSTACAGMGNADPADDRMMVAASATGSYDFAYLALVDLNVGGFDSAFFLGGPNSVDLSGLAYPPVGGVHPYPNTRVRGVFGGANGEWLLVAQIDGHSSGVPRGLVARIGAAGGLQAIASPSLSGYDSLDLVSARVGGDGDIRVLGDFAMAGGSGWGLMRVNGSTLAAVSMSASDSAGGAWWRTFKARHLGGGVSVAGALIGDASPFGLAPRLLVVRGDNVRVVNLPAVPALDGVTAAGALGLEGSVAATGAAGNRAVFAMGLRTVDNSNAGFYAALVQLGDGGALPDSPDPHFGSNGAASFLLHEAAACAPGQAPAQQFMNIASWGAATTLVGTAASSCGQAPTSALVARIDTDLLLRDGFE